jgi:hypothetical protein
MMSRYIPNRYIPNRYMPNRCIPSRDRKGALGLRSERSLTVATRYVASSNAQGATCATELP